MLALALAMNIALTDSTPSAYSAWLDDQQVVKKQQKGKLTPEQAEAQAKKQHDADVADDIKLGKEIEVEALKELKLSTNKAGQDRIDRIGNELAAIANQTQVGVQWGDSRLNPFPYKFHLVQGKDINAFSLPGGVIFVYEGLLKYAESDDELAGVLAHEISHAAFRHVATLRRQQSKLEAFTLPLIIISILAKSEAAPGVVNLTSLLGQAVGSGWSVDAEKAADFGGVQYMLRSKYNPSGILSFMERLAYDERGNGTGGVDWGIFKTHPPTKDRAQACLKHLKEANIDIKRSLVSTSIAVTSRPNDDGTVTLLFGQTRIVTLSGNQPMARGNAIAKALNNYFDGVPRLYELQLNQGVFFGGVRMLFKLEASDARFGNISETELSSSTLKNLKNALYELNARVSTSY